MNTLGLFGQFEWKMNARLTTLLGARFDYTRVDGEYGVETLRRSSDVDLAIVSPRLSVLYNLNEQVQARIGYARGFRAPQAFNEDLHISSVGGEPQFVILSDDLDHELSDSFTASLNLTKDVGTTQTNLLLEGFYTDLKNLLRW